MAADNKIRALRAMRGLSQAQLSEALPDNSNAVIVGFLESGRVLPTVEGMKALCNVFTCTPTEMYQEEALDLVNALTSGHVRTFKRHKRGRGHDGMTEFRAWMEPDEKAALERAVKRMGYKSGSEWFRESYRDLLKECIQHGVSDKSNLTIVSSVLSDEIQTSISSL
jgi:DNA-binding XRE family transcriptional regulator